VAVVCVQGKFPKTVLFTVGIRFRAWAVDCRQRLYIQYPMTRRYSFYVKDLANRHCAFGRARFWTPPPYKGVALSFYFSAYVNGTGDHSIVK
jgi:hypothetical protein